MCDPGAFKKFFVIDWSFEDFLAFAFTLLIDIGKISCKIYHLLMDADRWILVWVRVQN